MAQIKIRLQNNRRHQLTMANRHKLIAGENLSTAIRVEFPEEFADHAKRVDFLNERGETWTIGLYTPEFNDYGIDFDRLNLSFKLPDEVTMDGELLLQFMAYKNETQSMTPFDIVSFVIERGIMFGKRRAQSNPDLLIKSFEHSVWAVDQVRQGMEAIHRAEQIVENAGAISDEALATSRIAKNAALLAEEKVNVIEARAIEASDAAAESSRQANLSARFANDAEVAAQEALAKSVAAEASSEKSRLAAEQASADLQTAKDTFATNLNEAQGQFDTNFATAKDHFTAELAATKEQATISAEAAALSKQASIQSGENADLATAASLEAKAQSAAAAQAALDSAASSQESRIRAEAAEEKANAALIAAQESAESSSQSLSHSQSSAAAAIVAQDKATAAETASQVAATQATLSRQAADEAFAEIAKTNDSVQRSEDLVNQATSSATAAEQSLMENNENNAATIQQITEKAAAAQASSENSLQSALAAQQSASQTASDLSEALVKVTNAELLIQQAGSVALEAKQSAQSSEAAAQNALDRATAAETSAQAAALALDQTNEKMIVIKADMEAGTAEMTALVQQSVAKVDEAGAHALASAGSAAISAQLVEAAKEQTTASANSAAEAVGKILTAQNAVIQANQAATASAGSAASALDRAVSAEQSLARIKEALEEGADIGMSRIVETSFEDWKGKERDPNTIYVIEKAVDFKVISHIYSPNGWAMETWVGLGYFEVLVNGQCVEDFILRIHHNGTTIVVDECGECKLLKYPGEYAFEIVYNFAGRELTYTIDLTLIEPPPMLEPTPGVIKFTTQKRPVVLQNPNASELVINGTFINPVTLSDLHMLFMFGNAGVGLSPWSLHSFDGWDQSTAIIHGFEIVVTKMIVTETNESMDIRLHINTDQGAGGSHYWAGDYKFLSDTTLKLGDLVINGRRFSNDRVDISGDLQITYEYKEDL